MLTKSSQILIDRIKVLNNLAQIPFQIILYCTWEHKILKLPFQCEAARWGLNSLNCQSIPVWSKCSHDFLLENKYWTLSHCIKYQYRINCVHPLIPSCDKNWHSYFKPDIRVNPFLDVLLWYWVDKRCISEEKRLFCLQKAVPFTSFILMHKVFVKYDRDGRVWVCLCMCVSLCVL